MKQQRDTHILPPFVTLLIVFCTLYFSACTASKQDFSSVSNQDTLRYSVEIAAENKRLAKVKARFRLREPLISMFINGTPELPDGQAKFVQNLTVTDEQGKSISCSYKGEGDWKVSADAGDWVNIAYTIQLDHDKYQWAGGPDEAAYATDDGVYYAGTSLFIVPDNKVENVVVNFSIPPNWRVSTPWTKISGAETQGKPHQFFVKRVGRDLLRNCIFIGTHSEERVVVGDVVLNLAIGTSMHYAKPLLTEVTAPLLTAYSQMFGAAPRATSYLVVVNKGSMNDGEAFSSSFSIVTQDSITKENNAVWAHGVAHEILHLWNGISIEPQTQEEWFKEGCTDFMTIVWLRRLGIIDDTVLFKKLENICRKYVLAGLLHRIAGQQTEKPEPMPSLQKAGENKGANRLLIYGGGALAAFMLDVKMRSATNGAKGLDDVLRTMHTEFGITGKGYTMKDVERIATRVSGTDCTEFFSKYIEGTEPLVVEPSLKALGLQTASFVEEIYISRKPEVTQQEAELFQTLFHRSSSAILLAKP